MTLGNSNQETIIQVTNISKQYNIGMDQSYKTLSESLTNILRSPIKTLKSIRSQQDIFWALKDINFDVEKGEVLGIIGRNGAGKSTLLKILSRITSPSDGMIRIRGRVGSLLEVGTGFHPELTGRENIYFNGAILGMKKKEIDDKFDEIVDFSGVSKFLDTPVKRYSSGMQVRLAFSVAANLEPEILVVDEVLAVGDAAFQKKCLGKMGEVAEGGRTVLFVSHNMAAVDNLCDNGLVLIGGTIAYKGEISNAINFYLNTISNIDNQNIGQVKERQGQGNVQIVKIEIEDQYGNQNTSFPVGSKLLIRISYCAKEPVSNPRLIIGVYDSMSSAITRFDTSIASGLLSLLPKNGQIICKTDNMNLAPGRYYLNIALFSNDIMEDYLMNIVYFDIMDSDYYGTGKTFETKMAKVFIKHNWSVL